MSIENEIVYSLRNKQIVFHSKYDECINMRNKYRNSDIIIVYTGLYKTHSSLSDLIENGIDTVVIYNIREIQMMETIGIKYILKIKLNIYDIGIHKSFIPDISKSSLKNIDGLWLVFSHQWFIENINIQDITSDSTSYKLINKKIKSEIYEIINYFLNNNHKLKIIIIEQNTLDNHIFSQIKSEISNYMLKYTSGPDECSII